MHPAGKDTVSIIDIADPAKPKIVVNLPLMNTITGPPVNLAITPDQHLALVANSLDWVKDGDGWKGVPDNKIYVIDLTASPPPDRHGRGRQAGFGHGDQPRRDIGAGRQPRRRFGHRAGDRRQERETRRHGVGRYQADGRGRGTTSGAACCRRNHPRWQARARRQERRQPGGAARHRRPKGQLRTGRRQELRHGHRPQPAQCPDHARRQARDRQQHRRRPGRPGRYRRHHRPRGKPAPRHRSGRRRRWPGRAGDEPGRQAMPPP